MLKALEARLGDDAELLSKDGDGYFVRTVDNVKLGPMHGTPHPRPRETAPVALVCMSALFTAVSSAEDVRECVAQRPNLLRFRVVTMQHWWRALGESRVARSSR